MAEGEFVLQVEPVSERYDAADDRWQEQVASMYGDLDREVGGVRRETTAVAGTKGGLETMVLALGSAGAFTAAVEFFKSWLGRDRSRGLDITWTAEGGIHRVSVRGDDVDGAALQAVAEAAARRIGEGPWPTEPTEPS